MKKAFILILTAFILLSCNLPYKIVANTQETSIPTAETQPLPVVTTAAPVVETTAAPTEAPVFSGLEMNLGGVYMVIPECLASGAAGSIVPAVTTPDEGPYYSLHPEFRQITIQGYPLSDKFWDPEVMVYPIDDFLALDQNNFIGGQVSGLQSILGSQSIPSEGNLPFVYTSGAAQAFHARSSIISFQNGQGIGYLVEYAQYYVPANNHDLLYTYQGITSDGQYWVTGTFPVAGAFLQENSDQGAVVPAGGIPQPDLMTASEAEMTAYYTNMVDLLSTAPDEQFTPTISCINSYIASLNITN